MKATPGLERRARRSAAGVRRDVPLLSFGEENALVEGEPIPASLKSTHSIKTELRTLLGRLHPQETWSKRTTVAQLCDYAVHHLPEETADPVARRALDLARALHRHERR